jgi:tRNA-Thr(GGU) m(6)t(6)A37 methyltransferase TsaA
MGTRRSAWEGGSISLDPIGLVHSPFLERADAPRQAALAKDVKASVVLFEGRGFEDALSDLSTWDHIWLIVWFDRNTHGYHPKVQPPRSAVKRGLFATRAPYRPNPIGISAVRLLSVEGLTLHIQGIDFLDQTPVLDIKPYVPYTDAIGDANSGWLDEQADPLARFRVSFSAHAQGQLDFLGTEGLRLGERLESALVLGPSPHAYRRIREDGNGGYRIAVKDFRAHFLVRERAIEVTRIESGYKPRELAADGSAPDLHRAFVERFG